MTCVYGRSKVLAEVTYSHSISQIYKLLRLYPYLVVRIKILVQLVLRWPLSRFSWERILGTYISP
jgi:hypothetical protein